MSGRNLALPRLGARRSPGRERGYLLPAVVIVTAAIMIFVVAAYDRAQQQLRSVGPLIGADLAAVERVSAQAEVLHLLLTEERTAFGVGSTPALRVDDSAHVAGERTVIRLQDAAGLIDINRAGIGVLRRLFEQAGVPADRRDLLADRVLDFIDEDGLRRLSGAEAPDYAAAGAPAPRNRRLTSPSQLRGVLGWDTLLTPAVARLVEEAVTTAERGAINPNAATPAVLVAALDVPPQLAAALVARREVSGVVSEAELAAAVVAPPMPLQFMVNPVASARMRLTVIDRVSGQATRVGLSLTPFGRHWPWTVDSVERLGAVDVSEFVAIERRLPTRAPRNTANEVQPNPLF